jgi:hypothetical protein
VFGDEGLQSLPSLAAIFYHPLPHERD